MLEILIFFLFGLCFGSLLTLVSYRLPQGTDIFIKRSECVNCQKKLGFLDLIPVFSYILNSAKCRYCQKQISIRYPLIEIFTAFTFSSILIIFGLTETGIMLSIIALILIAMSIIDFEHYIIPDSLQIALLLTACLWGYLFKFSYLEMLIDFLIGFLSAFFIGKSYELIRKKEGLGFGDVKLIGIVAIFIGYQNLVIFYLFAGVFGVVNGLIWLKLFKKEIYPFGPALSISLFLCLIIPIIFSKQIDNNIDILYLILSRFIY